MDITLLVKIFFEFFKTGLFAVGGGLATLPFLSRLSEATGWFSAQELSDMIAISESTPGPIGINMATYVGYKTAGIAGSITAPLGLVAPSIIIIVMIARMLDKFKNSKYVEHAFYGLRPASTALIAAAGLGVMKISLFRFEEYVQTGSLQDLFFIKAMVLAAFITIAIERFKLHPILCIAISAVIGIVFQFEVPMF